MWPQGEEKKPKPNQPKKPKKTPQNKTQSIKIHAIVESKNLDLNNLIYVTGKRGKLM